jgi:hypothetical protein
LPLTCSTIVSCTAVLLAALQGGKLRLYGVARSIALCEADNEVQRIKEELQLLPREMRAHLQYLQQLLSKQGDIEAALLAAQQIPSSERAAAASSVVAAGYVQLGGAGRYQTSAEQLLSSDQALSGALSYVRIGKLESQQLLSKAVKLFSSLNVDGVMAGFVEAEQEEAEQEEADSEGSDLAPSSDDEGVAGAF